ncbi:permease-like cell division protein FtsX [Actinomadura kijaniata]|uniref:permease-like cell division protein FtsX n=1 Tax=Actinomadura kijaniata TaxID=46161 RepID=UPI003F1B0F5F
MNRTEERLADALRGVGEILEPGDVPAPGFGRRRRLARRPAMAVAGAALAVVAAVGTGVAVTGGDEPASRNVTLAAPADKGVWAAVFLCSKTSSNPTCSKGDVTPAQREEVTKLLKAMPDVRTVEYENQDAAYERFKERFRGSPSFAEAVKPGDIPESFRVRLDGVGGFSELRRRLTGRQGVDQVVLESLRVRVEFCAKTSKNPRCGRRSATPEQLHGLERRLRTLPGEVDLAYDIGGRQIPADGLDRNRKKINTALRGDRPVVLHARLGSGRDAATVVRAAISHPGVERAATG